VGVLSRSVSAGQINVHVLFLEIGLYFSVLFETGHKNRVLFLETGPCM
jgi:hypothetical protein